MSTRYFWRAGPRDRGLDYGPEPDRSALDAQLQAIPEATRERYMKEWVALQARLGKPVGTEEELRASFYLPA